MEKETKEELFELIDKIAEVMREIEALRQEIEVMRDKASVMRANHIVEVALITDDNGKRLYSNDRLREAALTAKLGENEEYQKLKDATRKLLARQEDLIIEHHRLSDRKAVLMAGVGVGTEQGVLQHIRRSF